MKHAKESIYLDSSVPSAYFDQRVSWRMEYTREWWRDALKEYRAYISPTVLVEITRTQDHSIREQLLQLVLNIPQLELTETIEQIATGYIHQNILPPTAFADALHVATASYHKIDFLVTWNCQHLAEAHRRRQVRLLNTMAGLFAPEIVTPMELEIRKGGLK